MNRPSPLQLLFIIGCFAASIHSSESSFAYRVERVDGRLTLESAGEERRLQAGDHLSGGEVLRTGWFSEAELSVTSLATRFHLGNRTRVELASGTPGLILRLEKGRARLLFDRLTGQETPERHVETPAALLAVRGTEYGVAVDGRGRTVLVVFDGVVEVSRRDRPQETMSVDAGQSLRIQTGRPMGSPTPHGLSRRSWDHGSMPGRHSSSAAHPDGMSGGGHGRSPSSGHSQGGGHHGG